MELTAQTSAAFMLGLLGSGHCLAMCGGIMGALSMRAAGSHGHTLAARSSIALELASYSVGRIGSYALLGGLLGLLGAVLVELMEPARLILRGLAGGLLIAMGLYLAGLSRSMLVIERLGHGLWMRLAGGAGLMRGRGFALGMAWGLLPCGLVYGTLAWTASQADPARAAWLMFVFGIGTLPVVLGAGLFGGHLLRALAQPSLRRLAGGLVVAFGIWTLLGASHSDHGGGGHAAHSSATCPPIGEHRPCSSSTSSG